MMNWNDPEIQTCPGCYCPLADQVCTYEPVDETGLVDGRQPLIIKIGCKCGLVWEPGEGWRKMDSHALQNHYHLTRARNEGAIEALRVEHKKMEAEIYAEHIRVAIEEGRAFHCSQCGELQWMDWYKNNEPNGNCYGCNSYNATQLANVTEKKRWIGAIVVDLDFYTLDGDVDKLVILLPDGEIRKFGAETKEDDDEDW